MIGKKTFAIELVRIINGRDIGSGDPDFKIVSPKTSEGESKIYIEDARALKSFFSLKPYHGPYKIAVIDDAHCLTTEAANALLKIIEEPPSFSVLILVTSMPGLLLPTIVSRCEKVEFLPVDGELIEKYIAENRKAAQEDKKFIITLAGGRIGLVDKLLESDNLAVAKKSIDDLRKLLSLGIYERMEYAKKIHEKESYQPTVNYWLYWVSAHLRQSPKNKKILKNLLSLHQIISQPQFNHRLALENFLLGL